MGRVRVLQVLDSLAMGGAQRVAVHLARWLDPARFDVRIASMFDRKGTDLEEILDSGGHVVTYHGKRLGFDPLVAQLRIDAQLQGVRLVSHGRGPDHSAGDRALAWPTKNLPRRNRQVWATWTRRSSAAPRARWPIRLQLRIT